MLVRKLAVLGSVAVACILFAAGAGTLLRSVGSEPATPPRAALHAAQAPPRDDLPEPRRAAEKFLELALSGRAKEAAALAVPGMAWSRADKVERHFAQLKATKLAIMRLFVSKAGKRALAITEPVRLKQPNPDRRDTGVLALTLQEEGRTWLVRDVDFESEESLKGEIGRFLERHSDAQLVQDAPSDRGRLQGAWVLVSQEKDGQKSNEGDVTELSVQGNKIRFSIKRKEGTEIAEFYYRLHPHEKPRAIDLVNDKLEQQVGIYQLEKDSLVLALARRDRPAQFSAPAGSKAVVFSFQRKAGTKPALEKDATITVPRSMLDDLQVEVLMLRREVRRLDAFNNDLKRWLDKEATTFTLKGVDVQSNTLTVAIRGTTLQLEKLPLTTRTRFFKDGQEATINDLKPGMQVTLEFETDQKRSVVIGVHARTE